MAAPTLLDYAASNWTDQVTVETTSDLDWSQAGDRIVVLGATEDNTITLATPTGTGITLSAMTGSPTNTGSSCKAYAWSATTSADGNTVLTSTNGGGDARGLSAWAYSGSDGLGTPVIDVGSAIVVSATVAADSSVVMVLADWNATTDVTVDTVPAGGTVRQNNVVSGLATFIVVEWANQTAGTRNYGVSNWTGTGTVSKIAVEVQGTAGGSSTANAEHAAATGTTETPTVAVRPSAENAATTGTAQTPTVAVRTSAETAAAAGAAGDATIVTAVAVAAELAGATSSAHDASTAVTAGAEVAAATATAYDADVVTDLVTVRCHTNQSPESGNLDNGDPITRGNKYTYAAAGVVSTVEFWVPTTNTGTYTVGFYRSTNEDDPGPGTGDELATATINSADVVADSWAVVPIAPQNVEPGFAYVAAVHSSSGRFVQTAGALSSPISNEGITTVVSGDDPVGLGTLRNGTFNVGATLAYPSTFFGTPDYFVDAGYTASAVDEVTADAEPALGAGTAHDATVTVGTVATAEAATATSEALDPGRAVTARADVAAAAGEALFDPGATVNLTLTADAPILATAAANDAAVATESTGSTVFAQCADATGAALAGGVSISTTVLAQLASAAAAALDADVGGTETKATSTPAVTATYTSSTAVTAGYTSLPAVSARRTSLATVG